MRRANINRRAGPPHSKTFGKEQCILRNPEGAMMSAFQNACPSKLLGSIVEVARAARLLRISTRTTFAVLTLSAAAGSAIGQDLREVVYTTTPETLNGYLCLPAGKGPFPAVAFNHGGVGTLMGGAPKETCQALAAAGFVGFAPIRRQTQSMAGHPEDVQAGLTYLLGLDYVDRNRVAMAGFSRGGALTFMAAARGAPIKAAVIMASAMPPAQSGFTLDDAPKIRVPIFLLVAANDTGSKKTLGQNTMETMRRMSAALTAAGNTPKLTIYPGYGSDGHEMFFEIGAYWTDVLEFLKKHL